MNEKDMFKPYDYDEPARLIEGKRKRDKYCVGCKHILVCMGKPEGVTECLNWEKRKDGLYTTD